MRRFLAALAAVCFFATASPAADIRPRETVVIVRGWGGEILSPMLDLAGKIRAKGYRVRLASIYFEGAHDGAIVIGHSMGCFNALNSGARLIITIDCPFWAGMTLPRSPRGARVHNFRTALHPDIAGAVNHVIPGVPFLAHVIAPDIAQRRILSLL